MIRPGLALALALAAPAAAQEGGAIRGGEHAGFTRLVMQVDPMTEWSLETGADRATIRFPGKPLRFSTGGIFDRIPKARVRDVTVVTRGTVTEIEVALGCDCRISTSFVGARYLALDIADRDAAMPAVAVLPESPAAREARETTAVATAEELLIQQIERAAGQGLVQMAAAAPDAPEPDGGPQTAVRPAEAPSPGPVAPAPGELDSVVAALDEHDQIDAVTVYDRDDAREIARRAQAAVPSACLADAALDVGGWATGGPWAEQRAALRSRLVGEFDRPDPEALRALARFYVRTGFGAEARALLDGFPEAPGLDDRALLVDLARVVDGEDTAPDGPLALPHPCPGRHALWVALGGVAPAFHDATSFADAEAAFAELPADLRARLAPRLIGRLLDGSRPQEARRLLDASARSGAGPLPALRLAEARTLAAEGRDEPAMRDLAALAASGDPVRIEALTRLGRLALDAGLPLPDGLLTDLRSAVLEARGASGEPELRALLVEVLAGRAEITAAVREARAAAVALPAEAPRFAALAVAALAAADLAAVAPAAYAETALGAADLIAAVPADAPARREIAGRLVEIGLPSPALRVVAPAVASGDGAARLVGARAQAALGRPVASRTTLAGLTGPGATAGGAADFALDRGRAGSDAWPAGAWPGPGMAPVRLAFPGPVTGADDAVPAAASPGEPVPDLSRPSLDAARRLLAAGPEVGGLVARALSDHR